MEECSLSFGSHPDVRVFVVIADMEAVFNDSLSSTAFS